MKRKLSLLLAVVLAMTISMGMKISSFAANNYNLSELAEGTEIQVGDTVYNDSGETLYKGTWDDPTQIVLYNTDFFDEAVIESGETYTFQSAGAIARNSFYVFPGAPISVNPCSDIGSDEGLLCYIYDYDTSIDMTIELYYHPLTGEYWYYSPTGSGISSAYADPPCEGKIYHLLINDTSDFLYHLCPDNSSGNSTGGDSKSVPAHTHIFSWQTIIPPTKDADGLEGEMCSCGATRNTQPLSAYVYALNEYATPMINAAKSGQTITFEFGEWNSFPKSFMAKLVDKSAQNVTFVFKYKWNHKAQTITISAGTPIDLNFDWYGPAKMEELYGAN